MKYRSEILFGEGYRDAVDVMTHETYELRNTDIPDYLIQSDLVTRETKNKLYELVTNMEEWPDDVCTYDVRCLYQEVLKDIKKLWGLDIKYVLWLCDNKEDLRRYDIHRSLTDSNIDVYEESDVIFSDIGAEGKLYGYETLPEPIGTANNF